MKSVEKTIFPLIFILCMCGFCVFEYPQGRPRLHITIFYILISCLLYIFLAGKMKAFIEIFIFNGTFIFFLILLVVPMFLLLNIHHHKKFKNCLKKLDIVTKILEELGTPKNYKQLRARMIWTIIGWIVYIIFVNSLNSLWLFTNSPKSYITVYICLPYLINYSAHINTLYVLTFMMLLRYIESLFEHVNQNIQKIIDYKKQHMRLAWTTCTSSFMHRHLSDTTSNSNQLICLLMHIHLELSSITRELNTIFGLQIIIQITTFHLSTLHYIFQLYDNVILVKTNFTYAAVVNTFCIFVHCTKNILEIVVINHICQGLCIKASQIETFLNRLANLMFDIETQENIMQFLLQILKRPLRITAFGFYDYGHKFFYTLISRAVKIVMIVIQAS